MEKIIQCQALKIYLILLLLFPNITYGQNKDIDWLRSINEHRNKTFDGVMQVTTNSTYIIGAGLPIGQLIYGYVKKDNQKIIDGWETVAGLGVTAIVTEGLKYAINRRRPYVTYPDVIPYQYDTDPSFPSGHASIAFSTAMSLSLEYRKWYVVVPSFIYAAGVGYSRLYLGEHYPSDVLVGAIIGVGSSYLSYKGAHWLHQHRLKKKLYSPLEH